MKWIGWELITNHRINVSPRYAKFMIKRNIFNPIYPPPPPPPKKKTFISIREKKGEKKMFDLKKKNAIHTIRYYKICQICYETNAMGRKKNKQPNP